ncbi:MAG: glycosyltransferase family 2 protein [Kordiimonadaceae bacterium]|nr:glycosyltransferase family 2 protein [Kordiimonadaceae bacterium]MBO6569490.1 glycosyltransferase family 2 protein [Kordiimonadaceae bacterium]MBO6964965.1 glycosyltransferase family 2 protein [Kordiimonadaceae bacterium]
MDEQATVGVVVPGYGHPRFLAEALQSVCEQNCDFQYKVVVVDDGCRFEETADVVANFVAAYPGKVHYLRHPNAKLPGARNAGIRFLLALLPELKAIYFLDADNRLQPYSLQAFWSALGDNQSVGWAYPDISFFGQVWNSEGFDTRETAPNYNILLHLIGNVSEAGSMVRADAFRKGVLYDETMQSGFEDWEFWLSMLDAGYKGVPAHRAGFSYRRRPESMLAGSRRLEESLIAYIRQKHKTLFAPRALMRMEQETAPAFAVFLQDENKVFCFTDPAVPGEPLSLAEFGHTVRTWYGAQKEYFFPEKLLVLSATQWKQMAGQGSHLRWLFWKLRGLEEGIHRIEFAEGNTISFEGRPWGTPNTADAMLCVSQFSLKALLDAHANIKRISDLPSTPKIHVETPVAMVCGTKEVTVDGSLKALLALAELGGKPQVVRHLHRRYAGPNHKHLRNNLIDPICAFEDQVPIPVGHDQLRVTVIVESDVMTSTPSQYRLGSLIRTVKDLGAEVCIVQEYAHKLDLGWLQISDWASDVSDIFPLLQRANQEEFKMYLGRRVSARLPMSSKADISTIGRMSDVVLSIGAAGSLEVLGEIKGFGPKIVVWLEPEFEGFEKGESLAKMLAYEHAIDVLVSDDLDFQSRLSAQGVPPGKISSTQTLLDRKILDFLQTSPDFNYEADIEITT